MNEAIREVLIEITLNGLINKVSRNSISVLGYKEDEMVGKNITDFILDNKNVMDVYSGETIFRKSEGIPIYVDIQKQVINNEHGLVMILSILDITRYKERFERAINLEKTLERANDIIYTYDIKRMKFTYLSQSITKNLGYTVEENVGNPSFPFNIAHPDDYDLTVSKVTGEFDYSKPAETRFRHKNGEYLWFEDYVTPVYNLNGELVAIEGITRKIQERKELELKLEYISLHDGLTGLYNRTYFEKKKQQFNEEQDVKLGIILCDLDDLKITNDFMGHEEGDALIKRAVTLLKNSVDNSALVSRIGGDEFVICFIGENCEKIKDAVKNIRETVLIHNKKNSKIPVRLSLGFSYSESSIGCVDKIFKTADLNMYQEKKEKKKTC